MGLFSKKKKPPKNTDSIEFKYYMANKINGHNLRYVLERKDGQERVIGKDGFISVFGDELSVICGNNTLFRAKIDAMTAWEFLSLEGVTLTGFDLTEERNKTVLAYYKYYRD